MSMTASTIGSAVRTPLANAFSALAASIYSSVPETVISPAIVLIPDSPYLEPNLINQSTTKVQVNLVVTAIVNYNSNAGSLDNLEQLVISILGAMPSGYIVGAVERPTVVQIGAGSFLAADISVSTQYTQTN